MRDERRAAGPGWAGPGFSWRDVTGALLWPRLLDAPGLALRPARLGLGLVLVVLLALAGRLPELWLEPGKGPIPVASERVDAGVTRVVAGVARLEHLEILGGVATALEGPWAAARAYPWSSAAVAVPMLLVMGLLGGAIARSAATECSLARRMPWTAALGFAAGRWRSMIFALGAPLVVALIVIGVLAVLGSALLGIPYVRAAAAVTFGLLLLLGGVGTVALGGYALGGIMLVPAVACEGTDAIDGVQRVYAYVVARPVRLVLYLLVLIVVAAVSAVTLYWLAGRAVALAAWGASLLLDAEWAEAVRLAATRGDAARALESPGIGGAGDKRAALASVGFWGRMPSLLTAAYLASLWFSAGTVLYLVVRRLNDGQDVGELWTEGGLAAPMVEGADARRGDAGDESDDA